MKFAIKHKIIFALLALVISFPAHAATQGTCTQTTTPCMDPGAASAMFEATMVTAVVVLGTVGLLDHLNAKEHKPYVALEAGSISYSHAPGNDGITPFPQARTYRMAAGYRFYNPDDPDGATLSLEASFTSLENSVINYGLLGMDTRHGSSWQGSWILASPSWHHIDVTAKVSLAATKTSTLTSMPGRQNVDGSALHAIFGIGMQYHINNQYTLRAQYENLGTIDRTMNPGKASIVSAGLAYEF